MAEEIKRISISVTDPKVLDDAQNYRFQKKHASLSKAIFTLIRIGLRVVKGHPELEPPSDDALCLARDYDRLSHFSQKAVRQMVRLELERAQNQQEQIRSVAARDYQGDSWDPASAQPLKRQEVAASDIDF